MNLPYLKPDLAEVVNHLKICPVCSDEACAERARGQRNQDVEVQITQFAG